ncbi:MAG TPA: CBS domain-containing protein [Chloroflexota bacterium]
MDTQAPHLLRHTTLVRSALLDHAGERLGRVEDLIVRLDGRNHPPVVGLKGRIGGRDVFIAMSQIAELNEHRITLAVAVLNLDRFERRPGEVLLQQDLFGHKLIDVEAGRLVRASDVILRYEDGAWRLVGIDSSPRNVLDHTLRRSSDRRIDPDMIIDWSHIEPFVGHVPSARLRLPLNRLKRLHPAQIADLVEAVSHEEGEEIITSVSHDRELQADVFEELDMEHQIEFLQERSDDEAAQVLSNMAPDDAADLIAEMDQARRASILARLPTLQQAKVRGLLAYNPGTAGGLMTPDFLAIDQGSTVRRALADVVATRIGVTSLYLVDADGRLQGFISLQDLLRASHESRIGMHSKPVPVQVQADADFTDVALLMADYNLTEVPVVDKDDRLIGVISVDDVLEVLIPDDWRRRETGSMG